MCLGHKYSDATSHALNVAGNSQHSHYIIDFRLTEKGYSNLRYILLLSFCVLRLSLVWRHLQSYLDMAHERIEKMKKETGRISNVELQRKVTASITILLTAFFCFFLATSVESWFVEPPREAKLVWKIGKLQKLKENLENLHCSNSYLLETTFGSSYGWSLEKSDSTVLAHFWLLHQCP